MIELVIEPTQYNPGERKTITDDMGPCMQKDSLLAKIDDMLYQWIMENRVRKLARCEGFRQWQERAESIAPQMQMKGSVLKYISTMLLIEQLNDSLKGMGYRMPETANVLDVGCGETWYYAEALQSFLQNYTPGQINLEGIDPMITEKTKKRITEKNIKAINGNVMDIKHENHYDIILMYNMLVSKAHFQRFGLEPIDHDDLMQKCSKMLKPAGIQATIGYQSAGEYAHVAEHILPEKRLAEFLYKVELGNEELNRIFTRGIDRVYRTGICLSKK